MQTLQLVINQLHKGDWLASLYLKDSYFHFLIRQDHRPYLRFAFQVQVFQFKVLPFGLSTASRVFPKILAPIMGILHQKRVHIYSYLDACLIVAKSKEITVSSILLTQQVLMEAGFLINFKKSYLQPVQIITFLGLELDMTVAAAFLPQERAQQIALCARFSRKQVNTEQSNCFCAC